MTTNRPDDLRRSLLKRGIRTARNNDKDINFIGASGPATFSETAAALASQFTGNSTDVATIGQAYENASYRRAQTGEKTYEDVYDDVDWSVGAEDPETRAALTEIFGDVDNTPPAGSGLTEDQLRTVLGRDVSRFNTPNLKERQRGLVLAQNGINPRRTEDTRGIRGVDEYDAPIHPIA